MKASAARRAATPSSSSSRADTHRACRWWAEARSARLARLRAAQAVAPREDEMHKRANARRSASIATIVTLAGALAAIAAAPLAAQTWPSKRVQIIVPFSPGSAIDLLPRTVFEHVSAKVGQPIIIENRPGGGGAIGVGSVAKAEPDGHTILVHSNALVTAPAIQPMPYDPVQDFAAITPLGNVPLVLVISP